MLRRWTKRFTRWGNIHAVLISLLDVKPVNNTIFCLYYRRTYQDVLELVEESFDFTLFGNMVRYQFQDSPILPEVSIHETAKNLVVLVSTVASVHRLVFPHPNKINRQVCGLLAFWNIFYLLFKNNIILYSLNREKEGILTQHMFSHLSQLFFFTENC